MVSSPVLLLTFTNYGKSPKDGLYGGIPHAPNMSAFKKLAHKADTKSSWHAHFRSLPDLIAKIGEGRNASDFQIEQGSFDDLHLPAIPPPLPSHKAAKGQERIGGQVHAAALTKGLTTIQLDQKARFLHTTRQAATLPHLL